MIFFKDSLINVSIQICLYIFPAIHKKKMLR